YQYSGSGINWSWKKLKDYRNRQIIINNSTIEMEIPLSDLESQGQSELHIGYIWKDSKSDQLPVGGAMLKTRKLAPNEEQPLPTNEPSPSGSPSSKIVIDGKKQDWSDDNILSEKSDQSLVVHAT